MVDKKNVNKKYVMVIFLYLSIILGARILPSSLEIILCVFGEILTSILVWNGYVKEDEKVCCYGLIFPIIISCFQNVYLGLAAYQLTSIEAKVLLSLHFLYVGSFIIITLLNRKVYKEFRWILVSIGILFGYSIFLFFINPSTIASFISSIRNILSCFIYFYYASILSEKIDISKYYKVLNVIFLIVILFGFFEYFGGFEIWKKLNVSILWSLKNIPTNNSGIPGNWWASEMIGGHHIRRMVSTFADPVNLGTFLLASAAIAFYRNKRFLLMLLIICCALTVSKGALLGILIFILIFTYFKDNTKFSFLLMIICSSFICLLFLQFSKAYSSGSVFAHIRGLTNAFNQFLKYPLGLGVGNSGVLANLFTDSELVSSVTETGIGSVIAQLGILGLLVYTYFFIKLFKVPKKWNKSFVNEKILYYGLLLSFVANALFNEVAFSPNSCGLYFVQLAVIACYVKSFSEKTVPENENRT